MKAFFCALLALFVTQAYAKDIVVFGDSWGAYGAGPFATVMGKHGLTVDNVAIGGTTAAGWAADPQALKKAVDKNPDAKYVWLSIGGNDALHTMPSGEPIASIMAKAAQNTYTFMDVLFEAHPHIKVVQFGYDILNWKSNGVECEIYGDTIWGHYCNHPIDNTTCDNTQFERLQNEYVEVVAKHYRGLGRDYTAVNMVGTLQAAGGVPGASTGHPVLSQPSPANLLMSNCIHANQVGFTYIFEELYKLYFAQFAEAPKAAPAPLQVSGSWLATKGARAAATHYEDPGAGPCKAGELAVRIEGFSQDIGICSPSCASGRCPSDVPANTTASPKCALVMQGGKAYWEGNVAGKPNRCALVCQVGKEKTATCPAKASCKLVSDPTYGAVGLCTYDS